MSNRTRIGIAVAAAVVIGYPLAAWVIGFFVERQLQAREEQTLQQVAPYVALLERHYRRSVFGASEVVTYGLGAPFATAFKALPNGEALTSFRLSVRNTIHHGPFPGMKAFALATVDTEVVLPEDAQKRVDALLGRKSSLASHTSIGWLGIARSEMSVAAFHGELFPGITVSSGGFAGKSVSASDLSSTSGDFSAKSFAVQNAKGAGELTDLQARVSLRRAFSTLNIGDIQMTVASLDMHPAGDSAAAVSAQKLQLDSHSSVKGDYLDSVGELALGSVQIGKVAATDVGYRFGALHLYGPAFDSLSAGMRAAAASNLTPGPERTKQYQHKLQAVFDKDGVELLLHEPVIDIPKIGFKIPEGEMRLSAKFTAPGLKRADFQGTMQATTAAVVQHLQVTADLRVDTGLLEKLTQNNPNADRFAAQARALEGQGYITQDGNALTTHIAFDRGKLTLNGKPFPPTPDAGGMGPGGAPAPPGPPLPPRPQGPPRPR